MGPVRSFQMSHLFAVVCPQDPPAARNIAFCIAQLALSDKALRKLADMWKAYHVTLSDEVVLGHFKVLHRCFLTLRSDWHQLPAAPFTAP